jgi:hypothetical protein
MNAPAPPARKIMQIAACSADGSPTEVFALADDGSVWRSTFYDVRQWVRVDTSAITGVAPTP